MKVLKTAGAVFGIVAGLFLFLEANRWYGNWRGGDAREQRIDTRRDSIAASDSGIALTDQTLVPRIRYVARVVTDTLIDTLHVPDTVKAILRQCQLLAIDCARRRAQDSARRELLQRQIEDLEERPVERHGRWAVYVDLGYAAQRDSSKRILFSPTGRLGTSLRLLGNISVVAEAEPAAPTPIGREPRVLGLLRYSW